MSKLLINEPPLQVLPTLAAAIGLNEAIVLQQLHYWLERSEHRRSGPDGRRRRWVYNSLDQWRAESFPFWSTRTIRRTFARLEEMALITTSQLDQERGDATMWYSIDYEALAGLEIKHTPHLDKLSGCPPECDVDAGETPHPDLFSHPLAGAESGPSTHLDKLSGCPPSEVPPHLDNLVPPSGQVVTPHVDKLSTSIRKETTNTETTTEKQQQQYQHSPARTHEATAQEDVVVVSEEGDSEERSHGDHPVHPSRLSAYEALVANEVDPEVAAQLVLRCSDAGIADRIFYMNWQRSRGKSIPNPGAYLRQLVESSSWRMPSGVQGAREKHQNAASPAAPAHVDRRPASPQQPQRAELGGIWFERQWNGLGEGQRAELTALALAGLSPDDRQAYDAACSPPRIETMVTAILRPYLIRLLESSGLAPPTTSASGAATGSEPVPP